MVSRRFASAVRVVSRSVCRASHAHVLCASAVLLLVLLTRVHGHGVCVCGQKVIQTSVSSPTRNTNSKQCTRMTQTVKGKHRTCRYTIA